MRTIVALLILTVPIPSTAYYLQLTPKLMITGTKDRTIMGAYAEETRTGIHVPNVGNCYRQGSPTYPEPWVFSMHLGDAPFVKSKTIHTGRGDSHIYDAVQVATRVTPQTIGPEGDVNQKWVTTVIECPGRNLIAEDTEKINFPPPKNVCSIIAGRNINLGTMTNNQNSRFTMETITISCDRAADVRITMPTTVELTKGANTKITTDHEIYYVNPSKDIPITFDTTVDKDAKAGIYKKSMVITIEIQ
ncbi:TPA: hypothetical protein PXP51_001836 [Yersinia enterocolitica]|nr:hypothetical protein [Yersinia enterocolitica]